MSLTAGRQALSDQILAVLCDASPLPLSTTQIGRALGTVEYRYNTCGHPEVCREPSHWRTPGRRFRRNREFVPLLRRLEHLGQVERIVLARDVTPNGSHFWRLLDLVPSAP